MIEHGIEVLKVIFLGIVEGITEWLPISSTGHMLLVDEFLLGKNVALPAQNTHPARGALGHHSDVVQGGGGLYPWGGGDHPV